MVGSLEHKESSYKDIIIAFWSNNYMSNSRIKHYFYCDAEIKGDWIFIHAKKEASFNLLSYFGNKYFTFYSFSDSMLESQRELKKKLSGKSAIEIFTDKEKISHLLSIKTISPESSLNHKYYTYPDNADENVIEYAEMFGYC